MPSWRPADSQSKLEFRIKLGIGLAALGIGLVFLLKLLLPWILLASLGLAGLWIWHRQQLYERSLYVLFYDLIEAHQGRISVLDFAKASKLPGHRARRFLDARAREFYAGFEPTDFGDVIYTFRSSGPPPTGAVDLTPADMTLEAESGLVQTTAPAVLSAADLALRLGCTADLLSQLKDSPQFAQWITAQDPDGWAWCYDAETACFKRTS